MFFIIAVFAVVLVVMAVMSLLVMFWDGAVWFRRHKDGGDDAVQEKIAAMEDHHSKSDGSYDFED